MRRLHRRQASSHRSRAGFKSCGNPVGAGLPAIRPEQVNSLPRCCAIEKYCAKIEKHSDNYSDKISPFSFF
ncbi:hypothetical protein DBB42_05095 [Pseudomonas plecoglossicida]|uniref:Uncharacterized protein n=1 Tax=Pseudomonas plecoglossicida TaxID=70775 RepID=A0A2R7UQ08_PSEDL|nr:hypothetical protein DBB42_05095 [Pseudomonas plecoglossicida]RFQ04660.1 hypothetical protein D0O09_05615 [Pseudomonas putida]